MNHESDFIRQLILSGIAGIAVLFFIKIRRQSSLRKLDYLRASVPVIALQLAYAISIAVPEHHIKTLNLSLLGLATTIAVWQVRRGIEMRQQEHHLLVIHKTDITLEIFYPILPALSGLIEHYFCSADVSDLPSG